jgi:hypothetical protein
MSRMSAKLPETALGYHADTLRDVEEDPPTNQGKK